MKEQHKFVTILLLILLCLGSVLAKVVETDHAKVQLVSDVRGFAPGIPFWVALHFEIENEWHIYWRNPGDTGLAPNFNWDLPPGFKIGKIQWPYPKRIIVSRLVNFAYEKEVLLMAQVFPPEEVQPGETVTIRLNAEWLICREECIPEEAVVDIRLSIIDKGFVSDPEWANKFNHIREKLPISQTGWDIKAHRTDDSITLKAKKPDSENATPEEVLFFPFEEQIYDYAALNRFKSDANSFILTLPLTRLRVTEPDTVRGILVSDSGWRGPDSERALVINIPVQSGNENTVSLNELMGFIFFAFLGGIILNLMPCVLPVLSLKVLGLLGQAGSSRRHTLLHGSLFTIGVLVSFWILAAILILLRAGGQELGWGFQLQSPEFVFILIAFLFMLGLSLFGVFEIGISLTTFGGKKNEKNGLFSSFLSGIMATIVATPCTAPFMGSALGFAVTQPAFVSIIIFSFLGLGMASPYFLLTLFPGLLKFVPKPGPWMESLKQFMGFLLMATVVWLLWVFGLQKGVDEAVKVLIILLFLSLGAWIYGRWGTISRKPAVRRTAIILAVLIFTGSVFTGFYQIESEKVTEIHTTIEWEDFSSEKVNAARSAGYHVFIDFTAAWCLSCKVNERVALADPAVVDKFSAINIKAFKADWTSRDDDITTALAQFGRNSVPLYVFYAAGKSEPKILPEILTPGIVLNVLDEINKM